MTNIEILKRLYNNYTKKYLSKILLSVFFTLLLAGSTSSVAYLLDPAIKQLFIEQKKHLILVIPFLIVLAFAVVVTGGLGSVTGAAIGALFIGLARTIAIFYAPQLELFIVFFVMAIILSFKPEGLFGSKEVRKI